MILKTAARNPCVLQAYIAPELWKVQYAQQFHCSFRCLDKLGWATPPPPSTRQAESASTGFAACNGPTWERPPADPRPLLSPGSIPEVFRKDASRALVQLLLGSPHQKQLCYGHHSTFGLHSGPTHWFFKHVARDVHQPGTPLSPGGIPEVFRNCLLGEIVKLLLASLRKHQLW